MALVLTCRRLVNRQHPRYVQCRQSGYVVTLPDVPVHSEDNPLLRSDKFQNFSSLDLRKCYDGVIRRALDFEGAFWRLERNIKDLARKPMTDVQLFQEYLCPIEELSRPLVNAYHVIKIIRQSNTSMSGEKFGKMATKAALALDNKFTSPLLYHCCKSALENANSNFKEDQKRLLHKYATYGKLNGLDLPADEYNMLLNARKMTLRHQDTFNCKVFHETSQFRLPISDPHLVKDFPPDLLRAMSDGTDPLRGPWTVRYNTMVPFLKYCPDALLRENVWSELVTFNLNKQTTETNVDIDNIRKSRQDEAKLLGFKSYADYSMETTMAGSVDNVMSVFDHLVQKARPAQAREVELLNKYAFQNGFHKPLSFWDVEFWEQHQLRKTYDINENDPSAYFPLHVVLSGLFSLLNDVFGIEFRELSDVDRWHKDVRVFEVFDSSSKSPIAHLYLDAFIRSGKPRSGGVALTLRNKSRVGEGQSPQIALFCDFSPSTSGKPPLLSFNNVINLFKRFGYALQVILSKAAYAEIAGVAYIEKDAAHIPGQFLSHWVYTEPVIEMISGHYETGEKMPVSTLQGLNRMRKSMAGFHLCNEIYRSRLDLEFFGTEHGWKNIMDKLWPIYSAFPLDPRDYQPLSFHEIFNDHSATYYSSLWSKIIAADIFAAFEEVGFENKEAVRGVAKRFTDTYLTGLTGAAENFRRFRGRDPSPDAFLSWQGLQKPLKVSQTK